MPDKNKRLRQKAIDILRQRGHVDLKLYSDNLEEIIEELQIYHIELEHQNEELKRITLEKEKLAEKYSHLYNSAPAGYLSLDHNLNVIEANATVCEMLGISRAALFEKSITNFIDASSQDDFYFHIRDVKHIKTTKHATEIRWAGTRRPVCRIESTLYNDLWESDKESFIINISLMDITQEKGPQEALVASEKRFRKIFEQNVAAICITDENGYFEDVNAAYLKLYKYKKEELIGKHFSIVVPDHKQDLLMKAHDDFIANQKEIRGIWNVIDKNGDNHVIMADAAYFEDLKGNAKKITFVIDITEREIALNRLKGSEANLKALNQTKDKFFSIVAHDLRNPLTAIYSFSEMLKNHIDLISDPEQREYIHYIYDASQATNKLLDNLLTWARSQTGKISFNPGISNIKSVIMTNFTFFKSSAQKKNITLKQDLDHDLNVYADENMIDAVIRNLMTNAIKFTQAGGEITIGAEDFDHSVRIFVKDNGIGMSEDDLQTLFDIGSSKSRQGTEKERGTGLGLLICKEFIDRHNGTIWAESRQGVGSVFYFELNKANG